MEVAVEGSKLQGNLCDLAEHVQGLVEAIRCAVKETGDEELAERLSVDLVQLRRELRAESVESFVRREAIAVFVRRCVDIEIMGEVLLDEASELSVEIWNTLWPNDDDDTRDPEFWRAQIRAEKLAEKLVTGVIENEPRIRAEIAENLARSEERLADLTAKA